MDKEGTANDLAVKMTAQFGVPMTVRWDFGTFRLVCTRVDGKPLTPRVWRKPSPRSCGRSVAAVSR